MSKSTAARVLGTLFLAILVGILGLVAWGFYLHWDVKRWDARIDALCAANGGKDVETMVYETVIAPETKEYFINPPNSFFVPERPVGKDLGSRYPFVVETRVVQVLNQSSPSVVKYTERIVRTSDNQIFAERFAYQRSGGGLPGIDPDEIRVCPTIKSEQRLDVQVFVNHPRHVPRKQK